MTWPLTDLGVHRAGRLFEACPEYPAPSESTPMLIWQLFESIMSRT